MPTINAKRQRGVSVVVLVFLALLLVLACAPTAPSGAAAPAPAPAIDREELRAVVQEAVAESSTDAVTAQEVEQLVNRAVAQSASESVSSETLETTVSRAVADALAEQNAGQSGAGFDARQAPGTPDEVESFQLTDVAGRTVTIEGPIERIILGEARQTYIVAALQPGNPFNKIIGWRDDLRRFDGDTYAKYMEIFPEVESIAEFGSPYSGEFSVERAIALDAGVVTLNLGGLERAREAGMLEQLDEVGIPVVVIDYRQEPLENTVPSTYLLGRLLGEEERAQEVVDFYLQQVNLVYSCIAQLEEEKPVVFMDTAAGIQTAEICCRTFGQANLGLLVERVGGVNLGSDLVPGRSGEVNPEQIIVADPEVIIGAGSNWFPYSPDGDFVSLGYFTETADARARLQKLGRERPGWSELQAVKTGRHHTVWHQFYNSPYHFVVLQQFAKWFYPETFADIDPVANFAEFHDKFLPIEYSGIFWVTNQE